MDKKELLKLMPRNKEDAEGAKYIVSLGYSAVEPVINEMLRMLVTYESPAASIFFDFFSKNGIQAAKAVNQILMTNKRSSEHLKYVIVTKLLPGWPRQAIEHLADSLNILATNSNMPETALMSIELLAKHNLSKKDWLKKWLKFITDRMERNASKGREIKTTYF